MNGTALNRTAMSVLGTLDTAALPFHSATPDLQSIHGVDIGQDATTVYSDKG